MKPCKLDILGTLVSDCANFERPGFATRTVEELIYGKLDGAIYEHTVGYILEIMFILHPNRRLRGFDLWDET